MKLMLPLIAAGLLVGATAATAADREAVSVRIDASSVDFSDPESIAAFRRDIARQIEAACNPGDRLDADMKPDFRCRQEMAANLEPVVAQLIARATDRQLASNR
jgi:UrcA family protein